MMVIIAGNVQHQTVIERAAIGVVKSAQIDEYLE
jgi:hypothetical protein